MLFSRVLTVALSIFIGLAVTTKDGWDRWIYAAFAVATGYALFQFRDNPMLLGWQL